MFFIVNKTKSIVSITDINITLGPRQAVDLDKLMSRDKSEASKMLKAANKKGHIDIRIKDGGKASKVSSPPKIENNFDDFKKEMLEEMKRLLSQKQQFSPQQGLCKDDLAEFANQIISNIPKSETAIIQGRSQEIRTDDEVEIDEKALGEMNKRVVNKMVENVESGELRCKEEKQENDLENNVSELEGLLDL